MTHNRHSRRLSDLLVVAEGQSLYPKRKHAAAIYIGNRLIAVGVNQTKTHPLQAIFGKNSDALYLHAEIAAIVAALRTVKSDDLHRATLYVAHSHKGLSRNSKPCSGCQRAIAYFGFKDVHWTT